MGRGEDEAGDIINIVYCYINYELDPKCRGGLY